MENLWAIRKRKHMTISQLAMKSGVPARLIRAYEAGERPIRGSDLPRLARALYVEEWRIKLLSDPAPAEIQAEYGEKVAVAPSASKSRPKAKAKTGPKKAPAKPKAKKPAPGPIRPTQLTHMKHLLERLGIAPEKLEAEINKPLSALTRREAAQLLAVLQKRLVQMKPPKPKGKKKRAHLPEAVDEFELKYLEAQQASGQNMEFVLFNGEHFYGKIVGFGTYNITIQQEDGTEVTLQKLALAYYRQQKEQQKEVSA